MVRAVVQLIEVATEGDGDLRQSPVTISGRRPAIVSECTARRRMDERQRPRRVRLAGALLLGTITLLGTTLVLFALAPADRIAQVSVLGPGEGLVLSVTWLAFAIVGAIIVRHQPANVVGWICVASGFGVSLIALATGLAAYELAIDSGSRPGQLVAWLAHAATILLFAFPVLLFLRFPTGRPLGPWFARSERIWMALAASSVLVAALEPGPLVGFASTANPFGLAGLPPGPFVAYYSFVVVAGLIVAAVSVVVRFRSGSWLERRQIALLGAAASLVLVDALALPLTSPELVSSGRLSVATYFASTIALTAIPVAIGIAIVRYRLFDIDRIVRRTLVYGVVSAVLAGVYVVAVLGLQAVLGAFSPATSSTLATAGSTLLVAVLFRPVRGRAQRAIDRRFDRERYEATRTIEAFARDVRGEVEIDAIVGDLLAAAARTVHPAAVGCWIRGPSR